jgi:hypothetical protein
MTVPDEAVEAALVAFSDRAMLVGSSHRDNLHAALEAAAPFIEKAAYERGWGAGFRHHKAASNRSEQ